MDVQIIASILGGLISGLFTFLGVFLTISYQRKKDKAEEKRIKEEELRKEFDSRPRFEIQHYKGETLYEDEKDVNIGMIVCNIKSFQNIVRPMFYYDEKIKNPKDWVFAEYTLKNIGKREISRVYFVSNLPKGTSIFNTTKSENVISYDNNFYSRKVRLEKSIKPDQAIKIRVYFVSEKIVYSNFGNPLISLWLVDEYGKIWYQDLDAPYKKISDAQPISKDKFYNYTDESIAIDCFIDPMLW